MHWTSESICWCLFNVFCQWKIIKFFKTWITRHSMIKLSISLTSPIFMLIFHSSWDIHYLASHIRARESETDSELTPSMRFSISVLVIQPILTLIFSLSFFPSSIPSDMNASSYFMPFSSLFICLICICSLPSLLYQNAWIHTINKSIFICSSHSHSMAHHSFQFQSILIIRLL